MKFERTKNSTRNILFGVVNRFVSILFPFVIRTVIIKFLGEQYLGINSLFSSIFQVLNLAELGFSGAIVYSMYKPIVEDNNKEICALLNLYRKIYKVIGVGILCVGLCLLPFIKDVIRGSYPKGINIYLFYILYLGNTSITYLLFEYKKSLLTVHQRRDLIDKVGASIRIVINVIQLVVLVVLRSYTVYLILYIVCTVSENVICSLIVDRRYPQYRPMGKLDKKIIKSLVKRVGALSIHKFGNTISTSLDNIVISAFLGLSAVAEYGNYFYIISAITAFLTLVYGSMTASIGNSIVEETYEKNYKDFNKLIFVNAWIVGWCSICLVCLYQPFMKLWIGKNLMLGFSTVILLVAFFYISQSKKIVLTFKDACGMWWEDRYKPIVGCCVNLVLNLALVSRIGINGAIISTIISYLFIEMPWETHVLFKNYFQRNELNYYFRLCGYTLLICIVGSITFYICNEFPEDGVLWFLARAAICTTVPNFLFFTIGYKASEFKDVLNIAKRLMVKAQSI